MENTYSHEMGVDDIEQGVRYVRLGIDNACSAQVEMVEEGGEQIFRNEELSLVRAFLSKFLSMES